MLLILLFFMKPFYLFESSEYRNFFPLVHFRPVFGIRHGMYSLLDRIAKIPEMQITGLFMRSFLADDFRKKFPIYSVNSSPNIEGLFFNPLYPICQEIFQVQPGQVLLSAEQDIIAFYPKTLKTDIFEKLTAAELTVDDLSSYETVHASIKPLSYVWDFIYANKQMISEDFERADKSNNLASRPITQPGVYLLNPEKIFIHPTVTLKPGVVIDAEKGPVYIDEACEIFPNAVIMGPVYIGKNSKIKAGAKIYPGTSIGDYCKVGGETEDSIIYGFSNKQHEGFLGHAYLGEWVNLGADTNNSDLKNNYSTVSVMLNGKEINTGKQFLGLIMGDHSKSAINTMFNTGTIVGVFCNVFGSEFPPKSIPSFSWGGAKYVPYKLNKALETAEIVMKRRGIDLTEEMRQMIKDIYEEVQNEWQ